MQFGVGMYCRTLIWRFWGRVGVCYFDFFLCSMMMTLFLVALCEVERHLYDDVVVFVYVLMVWHCIVGVGV